MTLTRQAIFDKAVIHLRRQGRQAMREAVGTATGAVCAYRGDEGTMCAVGALIPDSLYSPRMEERLACAVVVMFPQVAQLFDADDKKIGDFLDQLQRLHDTDLGISMGAFCAAATAFAARWQLSADAVTAALPETATLAHD